MSEFAPSLTWTRSGDRFLIKGRVDEHADLGRLASDIPPGGATLDLGDVARINSVGTREWIDFLSGLDGRAITLERCSPAFVEQMNAIANFRGHARVRSVLAVFECDECASTQVVEIDIARSFPEGKMGAMPSPNCPRCMTPMKLDDEPGRYFMFVRFLPR
jgi:hypothetical protein